MLAAIATFAAVGGRGVPAWIAAVVFVAGFVMLAGL